MAQWKYEIEGIGVRPAAFAVGFTHKTDHWVRFGTLYVPFRMFDAEHLQPLIAHWTDRMEGPPEKDTPFPDTEQ